MLLNTWLSAAKRQFRSSPARRVMAGGGRRRTRTEDLESRTLLTALVVNANNQNLFTNASGGISINNSHMAGRDSLVVEGINIGATAGNALTINLSGIPLESIALESIFVNNYAAIGFDIDLVNITGLRTIAIEDVSISSPSNGRGIDLTLNNTNVLAVTVDDSSFPGIRIESLNGSDIGNGLITENRINAGAGFEGILLNVNGSSADNFRIENNSQITTQNRDSILINSTNNAVDGLAISGNTIAPREGANVTFRAEGDTFVQPFTLTNDATQGERLQTFVLDLRDIGLEYDVNPVTGKPFTPVGNSGVITGFQSAVLSQNNQVLTLTFTDFDPGETLQFVIDIDIAGGIPASIFGDDLIGADVTVSFTGNKIVSGQMAGDPGSIAASQFIVGPGAAGANSGIRLNLTNAPLTNTSIIHNTVTGAPGYALLIEGRTYSDMTAVITGNEFSASGRDGIRLSMTDSNFTGAVIGNNIANNGGHGIAVLPVSSRSGLVQAAFDGNPVLITSINHGLQTGDRVMIQGMVNQNASINHPGNGLHTITRVNNNQFRLNGVNAAVPGVTYFGGGAWYVPDFQPDGSARGLVQIDMQSTVPRGTIREATNAGPIVITSPNHGLSSGQRVRISNVQGNTAANGVHKITVLDSDRFALDSTSGNGAYNTSQGFGTWTANVVTGASNTAGILITSPEHGLQTGDEIRVTGVLGNTAANGTFRVTVLNANTFRLDGSVGNGTYAGGGEWVPLEDDSFTGDRIAQRIGENSITGNGMTGIFVDLKTGTTFNADIVGNTVSSNDRKGIHISSLSFGLGTDLPLDPNDPLALPGLQDLGFDVNIGTSATGDGNVLMQNIQAGIVLEAMDYGTGSFEIRQNLIAATRNDGIASSTFNGDGIVVRLDSREVPAEAVSLIARSVIDDNTIGVDNLGNEGHGIAFSLAKRSRIQDLEVTNNTFLNNGRNGFDFQRQEDARLNMVVFEKNRATNNVGDGFSLFARNTIGDRMDFRINENVITDNGQYGLRVNVQADARIGIEFNHNSVLRNGHTPANSGFHPNDGVAGSTNAAGGVGILAFQQVDVRLDMLGTIIDDNFGDGVSVDAYNFFDTLNFNASFIETSLSGNTLTGYRNHGAAFGTVQFAGSTVNGNGEDGIRVISNVDALDFFERRVGGMNLGLIAMDTSFSMNGKSGAKLGQGVSAVLGDGTVPNANYFDFNGEDGLKITQSAGPYLLSYATQVGIGPGQFTYARQRHIQANRNFFRNNAGDGIDIGHHAATEGGNVLHGDEVVTDTHVSINTAVITGNGGDGIEYLADSVLRVTPVVGGGQDVNYTNTSSLSVSNSRIVNNQGRGIDILNRKGEDSYITLVNNEILSNRLEGIYVMNTASSLQRQVSSADPLLAHIETFNKFDDIIIMVDVTAGQKQRIIDFGVHPNIEIRVQGNRIESNGIQNAQSVVPIPSSNPGGDFTGTPNTDWTHNFTTIQGTLGGLVFRVGAADSAGRTAPARTEWELGLSGINAEVIGNVFDGNFGADVYVDSFTSQIPLHTADNFNAGDDPRFRWNQGYRDPLARMSMVLRGNTGNTLDVTNGFAFLDNSEPEFKSRVWPDSFAPGHAHENNPWGPFNTASSIRFRNQTRTTGYFNTVGNTPSTWLALDNDDEFVANWAFDGWGTPTFRVESDFQTTSFQQTNPALGYSNFFSQVQLGIRLAEESFRWDTGVNQPGFVGVTPYSLGRGDVFNVLPGEAPIQADSLEENDSFIGATDMGVVAGPGFSVNDLAVGGLLTLHTKADRDYYKFTAGGTGTVDINLSATDTLGDSLYYMLYEVNPDALTREVAVDISASGIPLFRTVNPGGTQTLSANVVAGREYIIEIFSDEHENVFNSQFAAIGTSGKPFRYGTVRSYSLSIDAPPLAPGFSTDSGSEGSSGSGTASEGSGSSSSGDGSAASGSLPGPPTAAFVPVSPSPRSTAVGFVTLDFSEDVTGLDLADFTLARNGSSVILSSAAGAAVVQISPMQYLINVGNFTGEQGSYVLTLNAAGSGIRDTDNVPLSNNATVSWSVVNQVTVFTDSRDTAVGDGLAQDVNGNASLRAFIMEANAGSGTHIVQLGAGTYQLTIAGRFEDEARSGDLDIHGNITIRGVSARDTIIDAMQLDRIFHVFPGATLTLENLTIRNGQAADGGAIFNEGDLILRGVNVILSEAFNQGGGIYNVGTIDSWNSSITLNRAGSRGGAVHNRGTAEFVNTTISSNRAVSRGGGIFNEDSATSHMVNVTVAANVAGSRGGGIASELAGAATLGNTIVGNNATSPTSVALGSKFQDIMGTVTSLGNNNLRLLDAAYAAATDAGLITSDWFGRNAFPLHVGIFAAPTSVGGNGTYYHPLHLSGNSVDRGNNALFPAASVLNSLDQIGNPRLIEANLDGIVTIDIGAVEYFRNQPVAIAVATPNPAGINQTITFSGAQSTHTNPASRSIVLWEWDFNYDGTFDVSAVGVSATTSYATLGTKQVALRVTDNSVPPQTNIVVINVEIDQPKAPVVNRPFAVTTSRRPIISWTSGVGKYRLVLDNLTTGQNGIIVRDNLTSNSFTPPSSLPLGQYRVVVTAFNSSGEASSVPYIFEIRAINQTSPLISTFDTTPIFTWTSIPGTSRYDIWVDRKSPTFQAQVIRNQFVSTNSYEPTVSLGEGTFTWWVRAYDADGIPGAWSNQSTFDIVKPTMLTPGPITLDSTPTFSWTNVGAPRYELWVNQIGGTQRIIHQTALTTTSFTPTTPLPNGTYRVWVRALAADGEAGLWSAAKTFQMDFRVGPILISPIGISTNRTPTFTWQAIEGVVSYDLWVNDVTRSITQVIRVPNVPHVNGVETISHTVSGIMLSGDYRWWVQATSADGPKSAWSATAHFTIPVPSITAPLGLITNTNTPTFRWTGVTEFVSYELWVDNLTTGTTRVINVTHIQGTQYTPPLPLENGNFRAWVRGRDAQGNLSNWSAPGDFTMNSGVSNAPTALSPRITTNNNRPTYTWTPAPNAVTYQLFVTQLTASGQPTVINISNIPGTVVNGVVSYTPATTLIPGQTYRWWVRGISANGVVGAWSQPLDFRVVSNDAGGDGSPFDPDGFAVIVPVVATLHAGFEYDDDVISIAAHPAETVIQLNPARLNDTDEADDSMSPPVTAAEQMADSQDAAEIDLLMQQWAEGNAEADVFSPAVPVQEPVVPASRPVNAETVSAGLLAGLLSVRLKRTGRRSKNDQ